MKKIYQIALSLSMAAATFLMGACADDDLLVEMSDVNHGLGEQAIVFNNNMPDNATRASLQGTGFPEGSVMGVYGFQTTGSDVDQIFKNQAVTKQASGDWTYSPLRYWNVSSTYEFYAIYPQDKTTHTFDNATKHFAITDFVVADQAADQIDVMVAQKNTTNPYNVVDMNFNHLLSNVNFYFKTISTFDFIGISKVEVLSFDVEGLSSKGNYQQTGFSTSTQNVEGAWTVAGADLYDFPEVTTGEVTTNSETIKLATDLLLLPQDLTAADKTISIAYRIHYSDGTSCKLVKEVALAKATYSGGDLTVWNPNYVYNYTLAVNPAVNADGTSNVIEFTASIEDWEETIDAGIEVK